MLDRFVTLAASRQIVASDKGAMLLADGQIAPTLSLPMPGDFGVGFFGVTKTDGLAPPVHITPPSGILISGYDDLLLMLRGDSYIVGCDATNYHVINFAQSVRSILPIHRTFISGMGAEVYTVKKSDRCALIRVDPRVTSAAVQLPARTDFGYPEGGYHNTFLVGVQKVQPTANYVEVRPFGTDQINDAGPGVPYRINGFNECVLFDNDSAEWKIISQFGS